MNRLLGRIACLIQRKHKRGRFLQHVNTGAGLERTYVCGRCGATWTRKVKAKP